MGTDATRYGEEVEQFGLSPTHKQVIQWVPRGARVLELGCAGGYIGRILIEDKHCTVTGVDNDRAAADQAARKGLSMRVGSLEDEAFRNSIEGPFDVVIAADVLEHLADPAPVLAHFVRWLGPNGQAIIAVPNIATWSMRARLFFWGDFEYQETGILDRTHLHFFTWHTLHRLVESQGWKIEATMVDGWEIPGAHTLLFEIPHQIMLRTHRFPDEPTLARRFARKQAYRAAERVYRVGRRIGQRLVRIMPNLAAPHVALLMRPADASSPAQSGQRAPHPRA